VSIITKPKEVIVHDPPTAADIDKATALVRADRDAEKQRADDAKSLQAAADQTQLSRLQSELATATNDREAFKKTADDLANELNATRAQLGPKSELLGLDDAKRWNIVATMSPLPKGNPCIAAVASPDGSRSLKVFDELRVPLGGWILTQAFKSFFPPGMTIFYWRAARPRPGVCAPIERLAGQFKNRSSHYDTTRRFSRTHTVQVYRSGPWKIG
jgi:hypothetical protein